MENDSRHYHPRHPMGVVCHRTGLKPDVLRAWEKRYGAVMPVRSSGNRRLYSDADIEKLQLLLHAIEGGRRIGQIAALENEELKELVAADRKSVAQVRTLKRSFKRQDVEHHLTACLAAVQELNARELELQLERAAVAFSQPYLFSSLLAPLMERIGDLWSQGSLRVANEHMASAVLRSFLAGMLAGLEISRNAPQAFVATPLRQSHEIGALMISATAAFEGWRVTYLGSGLPAEEIAAALLQKSPRVVALSIVYPPDDSRLPDELRKLHRHLEDKVVLLVGGRSAKAYLGVLKEVGAVHVESITQFREILRELRLHPLGSEPGF
ncbi:MerR family transcriptional regulator [Acidobacteria bacterium AH-259-D05]|nr:MerR family transcriptional regulator [Acidobacteria bacterium AH-259-D05]